MIDILEEMGAAIQATSRRDDAVLIAGGVPRSFLYGTAYRYGVSAILTDRDGGYQPTESGELAIIIPAIPLVGPEDPAFPSDDIGDLIAFHLRSPSKWWTRTGAIPVLNPHAIDRAEIMDERLMIHATPLDWLRAEGRGCLLLDRSANLRLLLGGVKSFLVGDARLGAFIEQRMTKPYPKPSIFVSTQRAAA
jgi:hypothetical protein